MSNNHTQAGNILLVANWESDVGYAWWLIENFWTTISSHYAAQGRHCYLVYPKITNLPGSIAGTDIRVEELDFRDRFGSWGRLRRLIREGNIHYIYLSDSPAYCLYYLLLRIWGIKKIIVHDHTPGDRIRPSNLRGFMKKIIHRMPWITADQFIAVTDFVYRRLIEVSCIPPDKCAVAPNGIKPIDLENADRNYAYSEFNIPQSRKIVVSTGRASLYKGIDFIIRCISELVHNRNIDDLHFLYCGDGPDLYKFRELATRLGVNDYLTFAGKRSDIRSILPSCEIGFHASRGEVGYSLSILEYMSAGLATIVPDLPSTSEAITHGETGLVFHHGDEDSACEMLEFCRADENRKKLATNAIVSVAGHYNIDLTNSSLLRILDEQFFCPGGNE